MEKSYVCPHTNTCAIYRMHYKERDRGQYAKINCISINEEDEDYFCRALEQFTNFPNPKKKKILSNFSSECALIKLLNNSEALLNLSNKGTL